MALRKKIRVGGVSSRCSFLIVSFFVFYQGSRFEGVFFASFLPATLFEQLTKVLKVESKDLLKKKE
jgi:hypothetical protein